MAFDFENLEVYKNARLLNQEFLKLIKNGNEIPRPLKDQLLRAASSIMLILHFIQDKHRRGKREIHESRQA